MLVWDVRDLLVGSECLEAYTSWCRWENNIHDISAGANYD